MKALTVLLFFLTACGGSGSNLGATCGNDTECSDGLYCYVAGAQGAVCTTPCVPSTADPANNPECKPYGGACFTESDGNAWCL